MAFAVTGNQARSCATACSMSSSFRRTTSARGGTSGVRPLAQVPVLDAPEMAGVQIPNGGQGLEGGTPAIVATHEQPTGRDDFVGEQRRSAVQDDEIHRAPHHPLRGRRDLRNSRRGGRPEKSTARSRSLSRRASPRTREPKRYASDTSGEASSRSARARSFTPSNIA